MKKIRSIIALILSIVTLAQYAPNGYAYAYSEKYSIEPHTIQNHASEAQQLSDMEIITENDKYILYLDNSSISVALENKADGKIYFSNPLNAANDPYYSGNVKKLMDSQIVLEYVDRNDNQKKTLFSSSDCAELGQYNIKKKTSGVEIEMQIGEI